MNVKKALFFFSLAMLATAPVGACRFTIREIGYTSLRLQTYIVQLEVDTVARKDLFGDFVRVAKEMAGTTNIRYRIFQRSGMKNGVVSLLDGRGIPIARETLSVAGETEAFYNRVLFSPLQRTLEQQIGNVFAFLVCFCEQGDRETDQKVENALEQFGKLAPTLDKSVSEQIMKIIIPASRREKERVVMRAAGLDPSTPLPCVMILYGRGRLVDAPMKGKEITTERILNQLVMLGTDCECGIDLSPLLERAIPLRWNERTGQRVADMLGFDADNPLILSEMSKILSKEPVTTADEALTFAPRTIDLDRALGKTRRREETPAMTPPPSKALKNTLLYTGLFLGILVVTAMGLFYFRKK